MKIGQGTLSEFSAIIETRWFLYVCITTNFVLPCFKYDINTLKA